MTMMFGRAAESAIRAAAWDAKKPIAEGPRTGVCAC